MEGLSKLEIRNPKSQDNQPWMKHGFNTDAFPCSIRVPSAAENSNFGFQNPRSLSLFIPAYNEEAGIRQAVDAADHALAQLVSHYEIIVVDDGSTDRTVDLAHQAATGGPQT